MKKFKFSLEALLSYRQHIENMARQEVAKIQAEINRCNGYIHELSDLRSEADTEYEVKSSEGISAADIGFYTAFITGLDQKIKAEKELLGNLETLMVKKKEELSAKAVDRKIIENLKEKRRMEYYDELDKLTQKDADDMVLISKHFKRSSTGTDQGE